MELQGKIVAVLPEQRGNGSKGEWVKNAFVIEWQDNGYSQKLCLEVMGEDKFEKMKKAVVVGYDVQVRFNVTSREYQGRFYTSASCFYCSTVGSQTMQSTVSNAQPYVAPQQQQNEPNASEDQLPF
jgi:hypothetical protein